MGSVISAGSSIAVCTAFDLLKLRFGLMTIRSPARPRVVRLAAVVSDVTSGSDAVLKAGATPPDCTLSPAGICAIWTGPVPVWTSEGGSALAVFVLGAGGGAGCGATASALSAFGLAAVACGYGSEVAGSVDSAVLALSTGC